MAERTFIALHVQLHSEECALVGTERFDARTPLARESSPLFRARVSPHNNRWWCHIYFRNSHLLILRCKVLQA